MYNRLDLMELKALYENMIAPILSIILFIVKFLMYIIGIIYISKIEPVYISEVSSDYNNKYYYYVIIVIFILVVYGLIKILGYFKPGLFSMRGFVFPSAYLGAYNLIIFLAGRFFSRFFIRLLSSLVWGHGLTGYYAFRVILALFPFVFLVCFFNFINFGGSLGYLSVLVPVGFVIWIFKCFLYSFKKFVLTNLEMMSDLLFVYVLGSSPEEEVALIDIEKLNFKLTSLAFTLEFREEDIPQLKQKWLLFASGKCSISLYDNYFRLVGYVAIALKILAWANICIIMMDMGDVS